MSESYKVVTAALARHARTLDELTAELRQALETAGVTLTGDAYGQVGQPFVAVAGALARNGRDSLQSEVDALESATAAVRATVTEYERQESDTVTRLAGVDGGLDPQIPATASTSDRTTIAASARFPEPVLFGGVDPAATTNVPPDAPPDARRVPSLRPYWGFTTTPPASGQPSISSFSGMNATEQNRVRTQLRDGVQPGQGGDRFSADNIEAALTQGPERAIPLYGQIGPVTNPLPAITFSSADLATERDLVRGVMSLNPDVRGQYPAFRELGDGLRSLADSWHGPREMWVQVPAGTSPESVRNMVEGATHGVLEVENVTVVVRDPAGRILGTGNRTPFP